MIKKLEDIVVAARDGGRRRLIVAYGQDLHTIEAVSDAVDMGIVEATLIGDPEQIALVCASAGIDVGKFKIIAESVDVKCVETGVRMVACGDGDVLMKGLVSTDKYMRGILNRDWGLLPVGGILSHVTVIELPNYPKLVVASDVAVIPQPDLIQKKFMTRYVIDTARALGVEEPKVAFIAPSEQVLPKMQSSVDAALLSKMGDRGEFGNAQLDGPLALDVALYRDVAATKKIRGSNVAGDADCLIFPNLDAANVFFKSCTKILGAEIAAMVAGTKAPCVLTSRGDSRQSKLYSLALACLSVK